MEMRKKVSVKNMEYTRYIGIRYALALLLFTNLNWLITLLLSKSELLVVPLFLLGVIILPVYEQIKVYSTKDLALKHSKRYFIIQTIVNVLFLVFSFSTPFYNKAFPFMASSAQGMLGIAGVLGVGIIISTASLRKIANIDGQKDRLYKEVRKYKNALKVSE